MNRLSERERKELIRLIEAGEPLSEQWRQRLFPDASRLPETGKEYRLVYDGKLKREEVLAQTPAAPWQLVRSFCAERPHGDGWRNLLGATICWDYGNCWPTSKGRIATARAGRSS